MPHPAANNQPWVLQDPPVSFRGGRKPELNAKQICQARKLLEDHDTTIKDVAEIFGVSRATIYRSLGLGKFRKLDIPSSNDRVRQRRDPQTAVRACLGHEQQKPHRKRP